MRTPTVPSITKCQRDEVEGDAGLDAVRRSPRSGVPWTGSASFGRRRLPRHPSPGWTVAVPGRGVSPNESKPDQERAREREGRHHEAMNLARRFVTS